MSNMRVKDIRPAPAEIEYKNMKFLITDRPNDQTIHTFIQVSTQNCPRRCPRIFTFSLSHKTNYNNYVSLIGTEKAQCKGSGESLRTNVQSRGTQIGRNQCDRFGIRRWYISTERGKDFIFRLLR